MMNVESMTDAASEFFDQLAARRHVAALERVTGTLRFDLGEPAGRTVRWLVRVEKGDVSVSRRNGRADCVVRADRALFAAIARGEANVMAAFLRGAIDVEGDRGLILPFQRLFPGRTRESP